ncbi:MAG TPA: M28 family peptidase [Acidimicrobiia bacterium]
MVPGRTRSRRLIAAALVALGAVVVTSCTQLQVDETVISSDTFQGRDNATAGSILAQRYLIDRLATMAVGINPSKTGDASFQQPFDGGTNLLAEIPGTDKAGEYVMIGAHYDHLGTNCRTADPNDHICNGATDNGAGVGAVLQIAKMIKDHGAPRRTVVLALWDREEDGLLGSKYYTEHPIVPLAQTVAYINFDIQGANLLPSLQNASFAVGAETGGPQLQSLVRSAVATGPLQTRLVSSIFGQNRSDYINFTNVGVPNVFFSDSTGPCYHTAQDQVGVVDFWKLDQQAKLTYQLARSLIQADGRPPFTTGTPLATFDDALSLQAVTSSAIADLGRFTAEQQSQLLKFRDDLNAIVAGGPAAFDSADISTLVSGAATAVSILTSGTCGGFLSHH